MFVDEAEIEVVAGKGGDGCVSFRREKYIPKGGPDGGDGGYGGHVYLRSRENIHGLAGLTATRTYKAQNGEPGRGKQQYGAKGESITIDLPPGTLVYEVRDGQESLLLDMADHVAEPIRVVKGGRGGLGNIHFASSTNQAPRQSTPGTKGERKVLKLVVSHIADVGLVGMPNVGKSTFLRRVSHAKPKVANYPFTTLEPHLGMVEVGNTRYIIADIPGLIEGAAEGRGLGHKFLKHLKRTHALLHLIDATSADPIADYRAIRAELEQYEPEFLQKTEVIVLSRADALDETAQEALKTKVETELGPVILLSSQTGAGVDAVLRRLAEVVQSDRAAVNAAAETPLDNPDTEG